MNIFAIEGNEETGEIDWEKSAQSQDNLACGQDDPRVLSDHVNSHQRAGAQSSLPFVQPQAPIVPVGC